MKDEFLFNINMTDDIKHDIDVLIEKINKQLETKDNALIDFIFNKRRELIPLLNQELIMEHAINNDRKDIIEKVIQNGFDVNTKNKFGYTPLYCAFEHGNRDIAKLLLKNGAKSNIVCNDGKTPFERGIYNYCEMTIKLVLRYEQNIDIHQLTQICDKVKELCGSIPFALQHKIGYKLEQLLDEE